jgi:hypothetical protein
MSAVSQEAKLSIIRKRSRLTVLWNTVLFFIISPVSGAMILKIDDSCIRKLRQPMKNPADHSEKRDVTP